MFSGLLTISSKQAKAQADAQDEQPPGRHGHEGDAVQSRRPRMTTASLAWTSGSRSVQRQESPESDSFYVRHLLHLVQHNAELPS